MVAGSSRQLDWILGGGAFGVVVLSSLVWRDSLEPMESLKWLFGGLLLIGSVVVALLVAWHLRSRPTTPTARELALRFEAVRSMSGAQFEIFTADLFTALGHQAVVLGGAGDQGVDVIVNRRGERVAVQCKNHNRPVGNRPVQEVFAGARHHRCVEACVVAPGGYTIGATAFLEKGEPLRERSPQHSVSTKGLGPCASQPGGPFSSRTAVKAYEDGKTVAYTPLGRRRLRVSSGPEALNTPIQAGALDVMKAIACAVYARRSEVSTGDLEIAGIVHDEVLVVVPEHRAHEVAGWLDDIMRTVGAEATNLGIPEDRAVPVEAGTEVCHTWADKE